jgi:GTP-dependent phosphoenolpyruvate carboxykinase
MYVNDMINALTTEKEGSYISQTKKTATLLYAGDITIIAGTMKDLQNTLKQFDNYCAKEHIPINPKKTKYMQIYIHRKGKRMRLKELTYDDKMEEKQNTKEQNKNTRNQAKKKSPSFTRG